MTPNEDCAELFGKGESFDIIRRLPRLVRAGRMPNMSSSLPVAATPHKAKLFDADEKPRAAADEIALMRL
jgi:hypothetical protein